MLLRVANAHIDALMITPDIIANDEFVLSCYFDTIHEDQIQKLIELGHALVLAGDRKEPFSEQDIATARWQRWFIVNINPRTILENEYIIKIGELV